MPRRIPKSEAFALKRDRNSDRVAGVKLSVIDETAFASYDNLPPELEAYVPGGGLPEFQTRVGKPT